MDRRKVIIVEDEALIAAEIKHFLKQLDYNVVGHAMNGDKALDLFAKVECDIIILDIHIKGSKDGIALAKIVKEKYDTPFVFLTSFSDQGTIDMVKETSPYGYILKPFNANDLRVNLDLALDKYSKEQEEKLFTKAYVESKLDLELTSREFALLKAFKDGLTYKEAGEKLFISVNTVKTYQKRLFQLFDVKSRHELMVKIR